MIYRAKPLLDHPEKGLDRSEPPLDRLERVLDHEERVLDRQKSPLDRSERVVDCSERMLDRVKSPIYPVKHPFWAVKMGFPLVNSRI